MSEKLTSIRIPGQRDFSGLMEWGECTADKMVSAARKYADHLRQIVAAIDAAADAEFQIDVVRGPYVRHHVKEVQASSRHEQETSSEFERMMK